MAPAEVIPGVDLVTIESIDKWAELMDPENPKFNRDMLYVIEVYADWCGPSLAANSTFRKIKENLIGEGKKIRLFKVSADILSEETHGQYRSQARPTYQLYVAGEVVAQIDGVSMPALEKCAPRAAVCRLPRAAQALAVAIAHARVCLVGCCVPRAGPSTTLCPMACLRRRTRRRRWQRRRTERTARGRSVCAAAPHARQLSPRRLVWA